MDETVRTGRRAVEDRVCETVRTLSLAVDRYVGEAARALGMPARDVHAIGVVKGWRGGSIGPRALGRELGVSAPATTALVTRITETGHARRADHGGDARRVDVHLTESGVATSRLHFAPLNAEMHAVLADLDEETLGVVADVLDRLHDAAVRSSPGGPPTP